MEKLMKNALEGRVVGFIVPYALAPSQYNEDESPYGHRIEWIRVSSVKADGSLVGRCIYTGEVKSTGEFEMYITQPPQWNADLKPIVGYFVDLEYAEDSIVPAGRYRVSKVNEDGSFHVGGRTAVWPERIVARYPRLA